MSVIPETNVAPAIWRGAREAISLPFIILFASFAGFGSLARTSDLPLGATVVATVGIWGLPGQVALAELRSVGADLIAILVGVSVANARFLLMVMSFLPLVRTPQTKRWEELVMAQLLSTFSWAASRRVFPELTSPQRIVYFVMYAIVCILGATLGTMAGYLGADTMPPSINLAILFLNPVFFALVFADTKERSVVIALVLGAIAGPLLHLLSSDWGLTIAGFGAGTAAFLLTSPRREEYS